ncbi:MAG: hydantoinase/oxoprolinase family protein [Thermoleophilia bacterium]|nr:hydantoinase/oxoprolinase family protein [Thermoleophilia bacterium]
MRRIGVDTGGTFTDCVLIEYGDDGGEITIAKVPSQPGSPHEAILGGVDALRKGGDGSAESLTHGTTIATNAVITNDFAKVGLITTTGFRDILEIGTQQRPLLYDLRQKPLPAMIPRELRKEVAGRISATGGEIDPVNENEVAEVADWLVEQGVEAIAVACLFSFVNPEHEEKISRIVQERHPEIYVGCSSHVSLEPREYPRFATAAVNAGLAPKIDPYVRELESRLSAGDASDRLFIMQSNGGIGTADRCVGENVHQLILSGPAAGVIGGADEAARCGFNRCVTFDVGGTSADIGVVDQNEPRTEYEMKLPNGVPCKLPHLEVMTIGAGGGSIARVDAGGALTVGPESAGADPGPACYGLTGTEPTVTDAHLHLGRLAPAGLAGGEITLDPELAEKSIADYLGTRIDKSNDELALGLLTVLEANMAGAVRQAAAKHGDDLRDFAFVAGGGAGPLHAANLIGLLGMPAAVIPGRPGLLSAIGLLGADLRHDLMTPVYRDEKSIDTPDIEVMFSDLEKTASAALIGDGIPESDHVYERSLDIRYFGQEYSLAVATTFGEDLSEAISRFHVRHEHTFGHASSDVLSEVVAVRLLARGTRALPLPSPRLVDTPGEPKATRPVLFTSEGGRVETAIYDRETLSVGQVIAGPAIIEQLDTTTVLQPGFEAAVHETGSLIITEKKEGDDVQ